eukprot:2108880-Rhodomonas_salina.1
MSVGCAAWHEPSVPSASEPWSCGRCVRLCIDRMQGNGIPQSPCGSSGPEGRVRGSVKESPRASTGRGDTRHCGPQLCPPRSSPMACDAWGPCTSVRPLHLRERQNGWRYEKR